MRNFISLKPCPMCGGAVKRQGYGINVVFEAEPLVCSSCGFWIDLSYYKTWREAIEDWNKQPYIDGLKERIEELVELKERYRWHNIEKEGLPKFDGEYRVFWRKYDDGDPQMCNAFYNKWSFMSNPDMWVIMDIDGCYDLTNDDFHRVTHWAHVLKEEPYDDDEDEE